MISAHYGCLLSTHPSQYEVFKQQVVVKRVF